MDWKCDEQSYRNPANYKNNVELIELKTVTNYWNEKLDEFNSVFDTAGKKTSELQSRSEEIIQNVAKPDKEQKIWKP